MKPSIFWLSQGNGRKWHAWVKFGRSTLCGRINVEHLRAAPAQRIVKEVDPAEDICSACSKGLGGALGDRPTPPTHPDAAVAGWYGTIQRNLKHRRIVSPEKAVRLFAERLAEIGPPSNAVARKVYEDVSPLLLNPFVTRRGTGLPGGRVRTLQTLPNLGAALAHLQAGEQQLMRVASALCAWKLVTGREVTLERCRIDQVVATVLQIPDYPAYLAHLHKRGLEHLAVLYHQNTLDRARTDPALRGLFSGSPTYWSDTTTQLNIVRD